jgi:fibro-slime domain-containing protein
MHISFQWTFTYKTGKYLRGLGDDYLWVFLNHHMATGHFWTTYDSISVDNVAAACGMMPGNTYDIDVFYSENFYPGAGFELWTNLDLANPKRRLR